MASSKPPNPSLTSFGVFTSDSALNAVSKEDANKLRWSTQSRSNFYRKDGDELSDSCLSVYEPGRSVTCFRQRHAELHNRSMTRYGSQYYQKKSGDYIENKQLAVSFRPPPSQSSPDLHDGGARTIYGRNYPWVSEEKLRLAKLESQAPGPLDKSERVMGGVGVSMETKPSSHVAFTPWPMKPQGEVQPLDSLHSRAQEHNGDYGDMSRYRLSFAHGKDTAKPLKAKPKMLHRGASGIQPGGATVRMKNFADRQSDYLIATRSFSRGFGVPPR
eukprot:TRINITY_DN76763_c0_g1_i1.p1 TRINITY_DN76763_c0_g1~~TRINITY_DN76763_c0_g1_i1.p1  ORF type:complete len:273 (+),score=23.71 TRINITY_DN76763_c0_g1_i1:85-903(+)